MSNQQIIDALVAKLSRQISHRMSEMGEVYEAAKAKVKESSCAGVAVWEVLDKKFA